MTITTDTIQYSNSKELFQPTGLKEWKGFTVTRQLKEGETIIEAATKLMQEMEQLHGLYGGNVLVDYSSIPGHPMYSEPSKISNQELDAANRERDIETYYQIINMKGASVKYLEAHRSAIEKLNDESLSETFENKLKELVNQKQ